MLPETEALIRRSKEIMEKAREDTEQYRRETEASAKELAAKYSNTSTNTQAADNSQEYTPLTTEEIYLARQSNSPAWKQHLEKVREIYQ